MDSTFHIPEMHVLTTEPSVPSKKKCSLHYLKKPEVNMHRLSDRLMHWKLIFLAQVQLRQKYNAPCSTWPGFKLMTSRSWTVHFMSQHCLSELLSHPGPTIVAILPLQNDEWYILTEGITKDFERGAVIYSHYIQLCSFIYLSFFYYMYV